MELKCKRCEKVWDYNGDTIPKDYPQYVSCPRCRSSVKIEVEIK